MALMREEDFEALVQQETRLGERSIQAARRVLVDGVRPADVSRETGVKEQQISRTVKLLEQRGAALAARQVQTQDNPLALSRAIAVKQLRDM